MLSSYKCKCSFLCLPSQWARWKVKSASSRHKSVWLRSPTWNFELYQCIRTYTISMTYTNTLCSLVCLRFVEFLCVFVSLRACSFLNVWGGASLWKPVSYTVYMCGKACVWHCLSNPRQKFTSPAHLCRSVQFEVMLRASMCSSLRVQFLAAASATSIRSVSSEAILKAAAY